MNGSEALNHEIVSMSSRMEGNLWDEVNSHVESNVDREVDDQFATTLNTGNVFRNEEINNMSFDDANESIVPSIHPSEGFADASISTLESYQKSLTFMLIKYIATHIRHFEEDFIHCLPFNVLMQIFKELQQYEDLSLLRRYFPPDLFPYHYIGDVQFSLNGKIGDDIFCLFLKHFRVKSLNLSHCLLSDDAFRWETPSYIQKASTKKNGKKSASKQTEKDMESNSGHSSSQSGSSIFDLLQLEIQANSSIQEQTSNSENNFDENNVNRIDRNEIARFNNSSLQSDVMERDLQGRRRNTNHVSKTEENTIEEDITMIASGRSRKQKKVRTRDKSKERKDVQKEQKKGKRKILDQNDASSQAAEKTPVNDKARFVYPLAQSLQSLNISYIPKLSMNVIKFITSNFHSIRTLSMENNEKLNNSSLKLISLGMPLLKGLNIRGCRGIASLRVLKPLKYLEILNISFLPRFSNIEELNLFSKSMTYLNLSNCPKIQSITKLKAKSFSKLKSLDISNCSDIVDISNIQYLTKLESLSIANLPLLVDISPIIHLQNLQLLNLMGCKSISSLIPLKYLENLTSLNISKVQVYLDHDDALPSLKQLTALNISHNFFHSHQFLLNFPNLTHFHHEGVHVENAAIWKQIYASMPKLKTLLATSSFNIMTESNFNFASHLQTLVLSKCHAVEDMWMPYLPATLKVLDISETDVSPSGVAQIKALQSKNLDVFHAKDVLIEDDCNHNMEFEADIHDEAVETCILRKAFQTISNCTTLSSLDISGSNVNNQIIMQIANLSLKHLEINQCRRITNASAILALGSTLQDLSMYDILISSKFFSKFPSKMTKLHTLKVSMSNTIEKECMEYIHCIPNLVYLRTKRYER